MIVRKFVRALIRGTICSAIVTVPVAVSAEESPVLATALGGRYSVTIEDVQRFVEGKNLTRPKGAPLGVLRAEKLESLTEQLLQRQVLADRAAEAGLVSDDALAAAHHVVRETVLMEAQIEFEANKTLENKNWELAAEEYYRGHREEFVSPEQLKVRHILIKPLNGWQDALERAITVRRRWLDGEDGESLALETSQADKVHEDHGILGFFGRRVMFPTFEEAAFALNEGEISDLIVTNFGIHVIRLLERKQEEVLPFETVKAAVMEKVKRQRYLHKDQAIYLSTLVSEQGTYDLQFNEEAMNAYRATLPN